MIRVINGQRGSRLDLMCLNCCLMVLGARAVVRILAPRRAGGGGWASAVLLWCFFARTKLRGRAGGKAFTEWFCSIWIEILSGLELFLLEFIYTCALNLLDWNF